MDALIAWLAAKFGPVTFGGFLSAIVIIIIDGIKSWRDALMKTILGFALSHLFALPVANWLFTKYPSLFASFDYALISATGIVFVVGPTVIIGFRKWAMKKAEGGLN